MKKHAFPPHWCLTKLSEIAASVPNSIVDGPFGSNLKISDYVEEGIPVLQGKNITHNEFQWFDVRFISDLKAKELKRSSVRVGDILLVKIGSIGYSAIIQDLHGFDFAIIPANLAKITPNPDVVDTNYLHKWITSPDAKHYLENSASKTAQPALSLGKIKNLPVPLPSLPEQRRIADILDRAEALRSKRRAALAQLDELIQSIFIDMFGDPVINPMDWDTKKLEKLCVNIFGGGTPSKSRPEYYEGNIPWVTPKDMKQDLIQDSIDHISAKAIEESSTKLIPSNCLLMVIRSGILKKKLPVAINMCEVTMNQDMKGFVFDSKLTNSYFMLYFFKVYQRELLNRVRSVTADNLEFDQIKKINVIVPPIEKQQKFVLRVEAVEKLKAAHKASLAEFDELFASLQYRAFRGEL